MCGGDNSLDNASSMGEYIRILLIDLDAEGGGDVVNERFSRAHMSKLDLLAIREFRFMGWP